MLLVIFIHLIKDTCYLFIFMLLVLFIHAVIKGTCYLFTFMLVVLFMYLLKDTCVVSDIYSSYKGYLLFIYIHLHTYHIKSLCTNRHEKLHLLMDWIHQQLPIAQGEHYWGMADL